MKRTAVILILRLLVLASLAFASLGIAMAQPPANVGVYAEHRGGKVVYHYRVVNNSPNNITAVWIGYDTKNDDDDNNDAWELLEFPSGWDFKTGIPSASATSPFGWRVYMITPEEIDENAIAWNVIDDFSPRLLPGQTLTGMSVMLDKADTKYLTAHAFVISSGKPRNFTVPIERLDTTPPALSFTLTPATLWPPNGKQVPITAAITARDDYDPAPAIKLESITSNEALAADDVQGAQFGSDDRQFSLAAKRAGTQQGGRIYTVTYSATDGSGNKATASATIIVPHDQGK